MNLFLGLLLWGSSIAYAQGVAGPLDAEPVLQASKARAGGEQWAHVASIEMRGRLSGGGAEGSSNRIDDLANGRFLERSTIAGETEARGYDGRRAWSTDAAGQVRIEAGASVAQAISEAYRARRAYWLSPHLSGERRLQPPAVENGHAYDVVRITPPGGAPFDLWIGREDHLPAKMVEDRGFYIETDRYSDYRPVHGVLIPYQVDQSQGDDHQSVTEAQVAIDGPTRAAAFGPPPPPPPDFELPKAPTTSTSRSSSTTTRSISPSRSTALRRD